MTHPNIFEADTLQELNKRINRLSHTTQPQWGSMNVGQMLAHVNVTYEMMYDNIHPKPNAFVKLMLKLFVKQGVVGPKPYRKNLRTAPQFLITDEREFDTEKKRLQHYLAKTRQLGIETIGAMESNSFGKLTHNEWNTMMYKHLDHHLSQFGV